MTGGVAAPPPKSELPDRSPAGSHSIPANARTAGAAQSRVKRTYELIVGESDDAAGASAAHFGGSFSAAMRRTWLHVGKVQKRTTTDQVVQRLKCKFPGADFLVDSLPTCEDAWSVSFKVGADIGLSGASTIPRPGPREP